MGRIESAEHQISMADSADKVHRQSVVEGVRARLQKRWAWGAEASVPASASALQGSRDPCADDHQSFEAEIDEMIEEGEAAAQALRSLFCSPDETEPDPHDESHHGRVVADAKAWIQSADETDEHWRDSTTEAQRTASLAAYQVRVPVQKPEWRQALVRDVEGRVGWLRYRLAISKQPPQ